MSYLFSRVLIIAEVCPFTRNPWINAPRPKKVKAQREVAKRWNNVARYLKELALDVTIE